MQYLHVRNIIPFMGFLTLIFLCSCLKDPEGYRFNMKNPDELKPDTDSIEVYIVYEAGGEEKKHKLYEGKKGDDGFDGPYEGIIEDYDGSDFKLRIIQFNTKGDVISEIDTEYDEEVEEGGKHVAVDYDLDIEKIKTVKILKDSTKAFGVHRDYIYKNLKDMQADHIRVYNGDLAKLDERDPSVVISYDYNEHGVEDVKKKITGGNTTDSIFSYDDKGRLEKIEIKTAGDEESLKFKYKDSGKEPVSTSHYNAEDVMDRLVKHVYNDKGRIKTDSVFAVDNNGQSVRRMVSYKYKDDSVKISEETYLMRQKLEMSHSFKFIYDDTTGFLMRKEKWEEGGKPLLAESFEYRNSRLGNPETAIQMDEESGELINFYVFQYYTIKYEKPLAKQTAGQTYVSTNIISRIPNWCLEDFECR